MRIKGKLTGLKEVFDSLDRVNRTVRGQILRKALTEATTPIMKAIRRGAARESGLLRKSIGRAIRTYRKTGTVLVVLGPRTKMGDTVTISPDRVYREIAGRTVKIRKPRPDQLRVKRDPVKYAHLVEYGTYKRAAKPFIRPAWAAHKAQARQTFVRRVAEELAKIP